MDILIASKHTHLGPLKIGGVQTWNLTVGNELECRGHRVTYWEPGKPLPNKRFNLGIFANLRYTSSALTQVDSAVKVSHGIIPDEAGGPGFHGVSGEVCYRWGCDKGVVRQPIDTVFWSPAPNKVAKTLLVRHSYRKGLPYLINIANERGLECRVTRDKTPENVRSLLRRAAVVVATGRAALEAMACGAPVVIADDREYQGPPLAWDPLEQFAFNYSGRNGVVPTKTLMDKAIDLAMERGSLRSYVIDWHDVKQVVEELVKC